MNIILPAEMQQFVQSKVESGDYLSPGEVVGEALRLLQERDELRELRLEKLRQEVQIGLDQLDRGEAVTLDEEGLREFFEGVKARGRQRLAAEAKDRP